ncbi:MAG: hypothetical protein JWQ02_3055 [Capsulimonas sp.]|nr:hypothetical protein [Capsulimonas sp.]
MRYYRPIIVGICVISFAPILGCGPAPPGVNSTQNGTGVSPASAPISATADLSKTLSYADFYGGGADAQEPLSIASAFAHKAGGIWIVFAPKPLDDLNPSGGAGRSYDGTERTIQSTMEAMRRAGTPMAWDTSKGYVLLDFAAPEDLKRIQAQPPVETIGLLLTGPTDDAMLRAFADVERIQIKTDAALLKKRADFRATRNKTEDSDEDSQDAMTDPTSSYRSIPSQQRTIDRPEFKVIDKLDLSGVMQRLGEYYGAEMISTATGQWELKAYSDPAKISAEIARLKQPIDEAAANAPQPNSSFEARQTGQAASSDEIAQAEQMAIATPIGAEAIAAFDTLGTLGSPAVPALTGYLDVAKPQCALAAIDTLNAMDLPAAKQALLTFQQQLSAPQKGSKSATARTALKTKLIKILTGGSSPEVKKMLTGAAFDPDAPDQSRSSARMALLKIGEVAPFQSSIQQRTLGVEPAFLLKTPQDAGKADTATDVAAKSITCITTAPAGLDTWAVFLSDRYGDPNDIWLARRQGGKWVEFLFTQKAFTASRNSYYSGSSVTPTRSCVLSVQGDQVTLAPPKGSSAEDLAKITRDMSNLKIPMDQRTKLAQKYSQLQEKAANTLGSAMTLSLADLRKDTDRDGLSDLVEKRFGTDPGKTDTDADGLPDNQDMNPLAGPTISDRATLLQTIFSGIYGGDKSTTPIIVVLDRPYWQEFLGASARVLCMTQDDYTQQMSHLAGTRLLEFTGPREAEATILQQDGPCLFNDAHTKAEVHFFFKNTTSAQSAMTIMMGSGTPAPDYIARFERAGPWTLKSIRRWKFDTAMQVYLKSMRSVTSSY